MATLPITIIHITTCLMFIHTNTTGFDFGFSWGAGVVVFIVKISHAFFCQNCQAFYATIKDTPTSHTLKIWKGEIFFPSVYKTLHYLFLIGYSQIQAGQYSRKNPIWLNVSCNFCFPWKFERARITWFSSTINKQSQDKENYVSLRVFLNMEYFMIYTQKQIAINYFLLSYIIFKVRSNSSQ